MFAGDCWRTLCLLKNFNMQKLCRRLEINFSVSCAPFVNVPESWLKLYRVCLSRTLLANVDWDAGCGELNLTERLSNGGKRLPDAMNAMVFCLSLACLQLSFTATKYTEGRWIDVATSSIKTRLPGSVKSSAIAWRGPQAYLRWVFGRLSWTKSATATHTLHLRWQKFAYANRK